MMEYSLLFLLCYDIFSAELIVTRDYDDDDVAVSRSHCCRRRCNRPSYTRYMFKKKKKKKTFFEIIF